MSCKWSLSFGQNQGSQCLQLYLETKKCQIIGSSLASKYSRHLSSATLKIRSLILGQLIGKYHWRILQSNWTFCCGLGEILGEVVHQNVPKRYGALCKWWLRWWSWTRCSWLSQNIHPVDWRPNLSVKHCCFGKRSHLALRIYFLIWSNRLHWGHFGTSKLISPQNRYDLSSHLVLLPGDCVQHCRYSKTIVGSHS